MAAKPRCFFDLIVNGEPEGRVLIKLLYDKFPLAAENFRSLCTGEKGFSSNGVRLHYEGTTLYVNKEGEYISGGTIGLEGASIYGSTFTPERDYTISHAKWVVSMNSTEHDEDFGEIDSRFRIIMKEQGRLDLNYKDLAIGKIVKGKGLLDGVDSTTDVRIFQCGQLHIHEDDGVSDFFSDGDKYPDIADLDLRPEDTKESAVSSLCSIGDKHLQEKKFKLAMKKYIKALDYVEEMENMNYEGLGDCGGALRDCNKALEYNGANLQSLKLKGQVFESMGELRQTLNCLRIVYNVRCSNLQSVYAETRKKASITLEGLPALIVNLAIIANGDSDKFTIIHTKDNALAAVKHLHAAVDAMNKEIDETRANDDGLRDLIQNIENRLS